MRKMRDYVDGREKYGKGSHYAGCEEDDVVEVPAACV